MINFYSENDFVINNQEQLIKWIVAVVESEGFNLGDVNFIFCNDDYLHKINVEFLNHDTLTDVISFDYSVGKVLQGDIYISTERVADNAKDYRVSFDNEIKRVMIHGILHYCGYQDKTTVQTDLMRSKENHYLELLSTIT